MLRKSGEPRHLTIDGDVQQVVESADRDGPISPLLDAARPGPDADHGTVWSGDGLFRASIPLARLRVAEIRDGRLAVPEPPTRCWLVKDVVRIEMTAGPQPDSIRSEDD